MKIIRINEHSYMTVRSEIIIVQDDDWPPKEWFEDDERVDRAIEGLLHWFEEEDEDEQ
jgi:hypothetical protein